MNNQYSDDEPTMPPMLSNGNLPPKRYLSRLPVCMLLGLALFAMPAYAKDCIWRVKNGNSTLYLAGSVGYLRSADLPLPRSFEEAFTAAEVMVFQGDYDLGQSPETMEYLRQKAAYPYPFLTIKSVLSTQTYQKLGEFVVQHGYSRGLFDPYRPFLAALGIEEVKMQDIGYLKIFGPGRYFFDRAKTSVKPRFYLETPQAEIDNLATVPDAEAVIYLEHLLLNTDTQNQQETASRVALWKSGDIIALSRYYEDLSTRFPQYAVVARRAVAWFPTIETVLHNGKTTLLVCDIGFFVGVQGLINLLQGKGYAPLQMPGSAPEILNTSDDQVIQIIGTLHLEVVVKGDPTLTFRWKKDGVFLNGASAPIIEKTSVSASDAGKYAVVVNNEFGSATSRDITVQVLPAPAPSLRLDMGKGFVSLRIIGSRGVRYRVEVSENLKRPITWSAFKEVVLASSEETLIDVLNPVKPTKWYRAVQLP